VWRAKSELSYNPEGLGVSLEAIQYVPIFHTFAKHHLRDVPKWRMPKIVRQTCRLDNVWVNPANVLGLAGCFLKQFLG
jgi:hypothetical protein